eukprot:3511626-Pleurochrysis_carterae.AAC.2
MNSIPRSHWSLDPLTWSPALLASDLLLGGTAAAAVLVVPGPLALDAAVMIGCGCASDPPLALRCAAHQGACE